LTHRFNVDIAIYIYIHPPTCYNVLITHDEATLHLYTGNNQTIY
jgi:hypothetical protein